MLLSHSNFGFPNVPAFERKSRCCVNAWLKKTIVRSVIASLGKQKGRHNIGSCFDKAVLLYFMT